MHRSSVVSSRNHCIVPLASSYKELRFCFSLVLSTRKSNMIIKFTGKFSAAILFDYAFSTAPAPSRLAAPAIISGVPNYLA